jgi:hypothetical protein
LFFPKSRRFIYYLEVDAVISSALLVVHAPTKFIYSQYFELRQDRTGGLFLIMRWKRFIQQQAIKMDPF